jgi:hypothetical protein
MGTFGLSRFIPEFLESRLILFNLILFNLSQQHGDRRLFCHCFK